MRFLAPAAFAFAATIPVVVVFYLLKRKRVLKLVPSTLLWQRFLSDTQANAPFQKLRRSWLLILQLLFLCLAVLALSRPFFAGTTTASSFCVVILDASASMQSTDVLPSRFEKARSEALKLVNAMQGKTEMLIVQAGAVTEVKQSATRDKAVLRRAIESCRASDSSTHLTEALKLAETVAREKKVPEMKPPEIHLFSDGAAAGLNDLEDKGLALVYHRIGEHSDNMGVVTLDIRENPENRQQRAIYTSVANYSTNSRQAELQLLFDNQIIDARALTVAPGETSPQVFLAEQPRDGVFTVKLNATDDLDADNQASIVSLLPRPAKVLLVSHGNRFLEKALRAAANVELTVGQDCPDSAETFDLVVLDDVLPSVWPKVNLLAIHVVHTNWFESWNKQTSPAIVDWKNTHPLLRYINLDNVQITESYGVKTPSWAVSLVDAQQSPLVLVGELSKQKIVWVGFDTLQSTWPLRISFPMFIANAVDWLNPATAQSGKLLLHGGETFRFALTQPIDTAEITMPGGAKRPLETKGAKEIVFSDTARQGIYHLRAGTNDIPFCVNILDAAESNTKPHEELQVGKFNTVSASGVRRENIEIWRWLGAVALLGVLFEWWYYHRRTA